MLVRRAEPNDIPGLVRLRVAFLNEVNGRSGPPPGFEQALACYFRESMADGSFAAWLAVDGSCIVATSGVSFYGIAPNYSNPSGKNAYVLNMYTLPEYRGRGLASQLFAKIVEEAQGRGCGKLSLHATDAGRPVYQKFGLTATDDGMERTL